MERVPTGGKCPISTYVFQRIYFQQVETLELADIFQYSALACTNIIHIETTVWNFEYRWDSFIFYHL